MYHYIKPTDVLIPIKNPQLTIQPNAERVMPALDAAVAWRYVPGRRRFLLETRSSFVVSDMLFGTAYHDGPNKPPTCLAYFLKVITSQPGHFSCVNHALVTCLGQVAARRVRNGELDPVDAFWFTYNQSDQLRLAHARDDTRQRSFSTHDLTSGQYFQHRYLSSRFNF